MGRGPLGIETVGDFPLWKEDLFNAWNMLCLPMEDNKVIMNHFLVSRIDEDLQTTVADLVPQDEEEFEERNPTEILEQIGKRLDKASTEELRGWRLQLARQNWEESPGEYKTRLLRYFTEAGSQEEPTFIEKYMETVCNQGLKELLKAHVPPVTTIETMDKAIQYYVEQLQGYIAATPDAKPRLLAGLGGMKY